jgi:hypothetical protein
MSQEWLGWEKVRDAGWKGVGNDTLHLVVGLGVCLAMGTPELWSGVVLGLAMEGRTALMEDSLELHLLDRLRDITGYTVGGIVAAVII